MFSKRDARPKYNQLIVAESNLKEERHYTPYEFFTVNPGQRTLAGKFYAKHDMEDLSKADPEIMNYVQNILDRPPHKRFSEPQTEAQEIGWYWKEQYIPLRKNDTRFFCPRNDTVGKMWMKPFRRTKTGWSSKPSAS